MQEPQKKANGTTAPPADPAQNIHTLTAILDVKTKSGKKKDNTEWKGYYVYGKLDGADTYWSTFSSTLGEAADKEKGTGQVMDIEWKQVTKGDQTFKEIVSISPAEPGPSENAQ